MGRPALKLSETKIRLSEDVKNRIKAQVGTYGMAGFIRAAVEEVLRRREAMAAKKPDPIDADS